MLKFLTGWSALSGHVSWDEYKVKFLATKGHNEREVAEKIKNKWDLNIDEVVSAWLPWPVWCRDSAGAGRGVGETWSQPVFLQGL